MIIQKLFNEYVAEVYPKGLNHPEQRKQLNYAFIAGFVQGHMETMRLGDLAAEASDGAAEAKLAEIRTELMMIIGDAKAERDRAAANN